MPGIPSVRVRFDLNGDPNNIGGTFSTGTSIIYSDANGIATTAYIPRLASSPTNGVTIRACYDTIDFAAERVSRTRPRRPSPSSADPLSVTIGSNERSSGPNDLTYITQFVVLVVDASGQAKANVDIVPSIDLLRYCKGFYVRARGHGRSSTPWATRRPARSVRAPTRT